MKCWTCKRSRWYIGKTIKIVGKVYRRRDKCLNCGSVRSTIVGKPISLLRKCPCPIKSSLVKAGKYRTKSRPKLRGRYKCKECNKSFTSRTFNNKKYKWKRYDLKVMKEIERLAKTPKPFLNKYDSTKSPVYSTREIAKVINKMFYGRKIGKSGVHSFLKSIKRLEEKQNEKRKV